MATPLYQEIAESIRQAIFYEELKPGDELPPIRDMSVKWNCAPGTVQRAYHELAQQGLVTSRTGQGTRVATSPAYEQPDPLRRATLANEVEAVVLRFLSSGYSLGEVDRAIQLALDRWRAISQESEPTAEHVIRFVGSHDPLLAKIAEQFKTLVPDQTLQVSFAGSLGGLIALSERKADFAGCHLWDEETDTYNLPFVQRLLPRQRAAFLTLAHRRLGLMVAVGNPLGVNTLADLTAPGVRFINRQSGAGTRVWLDAQLYRAGINTEQIAGYDQQVMTHTEVARAIVDDLADVGLGIETVARAYGLDFHVLTHERYDLVIPEPMWNTESIQQLAEWLASEAAQVLFEDMAGYDTQETGCVRWSDGGAVGD